ncbi:MAG TPA: plastocyanin/azurin family copper-binding protein [Terriglobales bacterium]|jgi:plastocyanin|nr:plastocyanin/azurin family copper-binding protein [Terriglobales bacterium]
MRVRNRGSIPVVEFLLWRGLPWLLLLALPPTSALGRHTADDQSTPAVTVRMNAANKFDPEKVTIKAGEAVRWVNENAGPSHTVTTDPSMVQNENDVESPDGAKPFSSGVIKPGKFYQHTFDVPGTYRYACAPHEGSKMLGVVVVTK